MSFGITNYNLSELLMHALMASACARLRIELQSPSNHKKRWAQRVLKFLPQEALDGLCCPEGPWEKWLRGLVASQDPKSSSVYMLFPIRRSTRDNQICTGADVSQVLACRCVSRIKSEP